MKTLLEMKMPLESGLMTTARLTAGGICSLFGLDLEESEDCKVCLTESLLLLRHAGYSEAAIRFADDSALSICITGEGTAQGAEEHAEDEISYALLGALNDSVVTKKEGGRLSEITFRFGKKA